MSNKSCVYCASENTNQLTFDVWECWDCQREFTFAWVPALLDESEQNTFPTSEKPGEILTGRRRIRAIKVFLSWCEHGQAYVDWSRDFTKAPLAKWSKTRTNTKKGLRRIAAVLVLGHLVSQTWDGGAFRQCHYESMYGDFTITVANWRGCPMSYQTEIDL